MTPGPWGAIIPITVTAGMASRLGFSSVRHGTLLKDPIYRMRCI
jgi:hypothetical protein